MKALPTYRFSASDRRVAPRRASLTALFVVFATIAGCADVGDDSTDDAGRVDVNRGGSAGTSGSSTTGTAGTGGTSATGGSAGTGGQPVMDAQSDAGSIDASIDGSGLGDGGLPDAPRVDARIDASVDVRPDLGGGPVDAPPQIPEAEAGPLCGNGTIDPGEECDDKNQKDLDTCTSLCTDNRPCLDCEALNCPHDPAGCNDVNGCQEMPNCDDYPKAEDKALCYAVYACVIRTGCALTAMGATACFCGHTTPDELVACKEGSFAPIGACKDEIKAAFKPVFPIPVIDAAAIVNGFTDVGSPSGGPLKIVTCNIQYCGAPEQGGNNECDPKKHPPYSGGEGGADSGTGGGSDGGSTTDTTMDSVLFDRNPEGG